MSGERQEWDKTEMQKAADDTVESQAETPGSWGIFSEHTLAWYPFLSTQFVYTEIGPKITVRLVVVPVQELSRIVWTWPKMI